MFQTTNIFLRTTFNDLHVISFGKENLQRRNASPNWYKTKTLLVVIFIHHSIFLTYTPISNKVASVIHDA